MSMCRKNNESEKQKFIPTADYKFITIICKLFIAESLMWFGVNLAEHLINFVYIHKLQFNENHSP